MAIYTRLGAPVRFDQAKKRKRWWVRFAGRSETFDEMPTATQCRGAKEKYAFDIWWITATQIGPYPDGSGTEHIGKPYLDGRWLDENEFRADDGIREIHAECEAVRIKTAA